MAENFKNKKIYRDFLPKFALTCYTWSFLVRIFVVWSIYIYMHFGQIHPIPFFHFLPFSLALLTPCFMCSHKCIESSHCCLYVMSIGISSKSRTVFQGPNHSRVLAPHNQGCTNHPRKFKRKVRRPGSFCEARKCMSDERATVEKGTPEWQSSDENQSYLKTSVHHDYVRFVPQMQVRYNTERYFSVI